MTIASTTAGTGSNVPAAAPSGPGRADCFGAGVVDGAADGLGEMVAVAVTVGDAGAIGEAAVAVAASVDVAVTVGVTVGDVVARAVGVTVGFAVGVGVEPALTTIVPVICSGWIWQKYWIVPTVWKVTWNVLPGVLIPESKTLSGAPGEPDVTVCGSPAKVQLTTSPTWIDRKAGWKL